MKKQVQLNPRLHFVVATAIVHKDGKFLIAKRSPKELAFPNKWTVPGGKLKFDEYGKLKSTTKSYKSWYNIVEWVVRREVREETGLEIKGLNYVCDLVFIRPDGYPVLTLSYWADYKSGKVKLSPELTEYAWVTLKDLPRHDLIENIDEEIKMAAKAIQKIRKK